MNPATALLLLSTPGLWTCVNLDPLTICQATTDVCVTANPHEMLMTERDANAITVTPLRGPVADAAWNLVLLRAVDAMALARDRAEQARLERMETAR